MIRWLVARTIAQQLSETVERTTAPFQYTLSTKAGCECVAHALQGLTDLDPEATVLSIDGISAYDLISRRAMLTALANVDGGEQVLPFVRLFHGAPSVYWWEDNLGTVHEVEQGEGGEQGDALMPLLFSLGQHDALRTVQSSLHLEERLFAFLDDIYVVCKPRRVGVVHTISQCTQAKPRSGTEVVFDQRPVISWNTVHDWCWKLHVCGEEVWRRSPQNAGSRSWALLWAILNMSRGSWSLSEHINRLCWNAFR